MKLSSRLPVISVIFSLLLLQGCSGGGGDGATTVSGTTSFTVSTSTGGNGSISPANASVNQNDTASFTVTPDTSYRIDTVSGCGGALAGDTYTTSTITADCTIMVSFTLVEALSLAPQFPGVGAKWNDYVQGNTSTATDTPCNAASDTACVHSGERWVVVATGRPSCSGITAADELGVFNWVCDGTTNPVRLFSTGLADGKYLSDLIDFTLLQFKPNKVTVRDSGAIWGATTSTVWWPNNPVVENNVGGALDVAETVYLVTSNPAAAYTVGANKVSLVIQPGVTLSGPGTSANLVTASDQNHLWLEGQINAANDSRGVDLFQVRYSVLRNVKVTNSGTGIGIDNSSFSASHITLTDVIASNNSFSGVLFDRSSNNTLSGVTASNNGGDGILFFAGFSDNNTIVNVTASGNGGDGLRILIGHDNTIIGVTANNNGDGAFTGGIRLSANGANNLIAGVTANNNLSDGLIIDSTDNNLLTDVAVGHNASGDIVLTNSSNNRFTGRLQVFNASPGNCIVSGGANQGLFDGTCANDGGAGSDATLIAGITPASSFVGKVSIEDGVNTGDTNGGSAYPLNPATFDWTHFDNSYRAWGIDGSAFPNADHQGRWISAPTTGRIWDWSLSASDTVLRNVLALPTGNDSLTHTWSDASTTTFLRHAVEISGDRVGNDNALCESGETCLYTPNIGSYQGHGNLVDAGTFVDGTLTGITLIKYETNGR